MFGVLLAVAALGAVIFYIYNPEYCRERLKSSVAMVIVAVIIAALVIAVYAIVN